MCLNRERGLGKMSDTTVGGEKGLKLPYLHGSFIKKSQK